MSSSKSGPRYVLGYELLAQVSKYINHEYLAHTTLIVPYIGRNPESSFESSLYSYFGPLRFLPPMLL